MKPNSIQQEVYENRICSMVGHQLQQYYPNWEWYVECKLMTGMVSVRNLDLDGDYGFYIPLNKLLNETDPKLVMLAGGEILERHKQHTGIRKNFDLKKDFAGRVEGDKYAV